MKIIFLLGSMMLLTGCATTKITPVQLSPGEKIQKVCIKHNPKVIVQNLEDIITSRLEYHNIATQVYSGERPELCEYSLRYVAYQKWDFSMVLTQAQLIFYKNEKRVGVAEYKLHAGGLLNPTKYKSNESKIEPLVDQLIGEIQ
jgi:hypothetical protein